MERLAFITLLGGTIPIIFVMVGDPVGIGPLAVVQPNAIDAAFRTGLKLALESGSSQVSAFLPGMSDATSIAVEHGVRITIPMLLMSTCDFGHWRRYLPRNPGFM
jgi:hypothetical protein